MCFLVKDKHYPTFRGEEQLFVLSTSRVFSTNKVVIEMHFDINPAP